MTGWTPKRVLEEAAAWVWVPDGADQVCTEDYQLLRYPDRLTDPAWPPAQVAWSRTTRPLDDIIEEVGGQVRAWGLDEVHWWVSEATGPAGTAEILLARGGAVTETLQVLGYDLGGGPLALDLPGDIAVEVVHDERTLRAALRLETQGWGRPAAGEADVARQLDELTADPPDKSSFRVLAFMHSQPVAVAGCTIAGPVARLWGGVTLPAWRGRGAYRAVLAERLRLASDLGASLALVKGRAGTSGPILHRAGFTRYGEERLYRFPVGWVPASSA